MPRFQKGDIVRLKSGGPPMTVKEIGEYVGSPEGASCVWFDGRKQHAAVFDVATLEYADNSGQSKKASMTVG